MREQPFCFNHPKRTATSCSKYRSYMTLNLTESVKKKKCRGYIFHPTNIKRFKVEMMTYPVFVFYITDSIYINSRWQ